MSHINFECSTGIVLICLFQIGSGYLLPGGEGDLLFTHGDKDLSLDLALSSLIIDLGRDQDHVLLCELAILGVLEADLLFLKSMQDFVPSQ